jgi:hypothetical protein
MWPARKYYAFAVVFKRNLMSGHCCEKRGQITFISEKWGQITFISGNINSKLSGDCAYSSLAHTAGV